MSVYSIIYNTLSTLGYPVKQQGTYAPGATLPETFITYQIVDSQNTTFADNVPTSRTTSLQVTLYSKQPSIHQSADDALKNLLLPAGFLRVGGRDLPYDPGTGHYAWTCDFRYYEMEE